MSFNIVNFLLIFKPTRILIFVIIESAIGVTGIVFEGGHAYPVVQTIGGSLMIALGGAFLGFCGFAPILSQRIRKNWCNPHADFEQGKVGLIFVGIVGSFFAFMGVFIVVTRLAGPGLFGH